MSFWGGRRAGATSRYRLSSAVQRKDGKKNIRMWRLIVCDTSAVLITGANKCEKANISASVLRVCV